jgi:hypothetical protein
MRISAMLLSDWNPLPRAVADALLACARADAANGDGDYYEPHEPRLAESGLPWFYFITVSMNLLDDLKEVYIRDSERLWGARHWGT